MSDGTINDYHHRLEHWTSLEGWRQSVLEIEPSEKFKKGRPTPISGLTVLTPPAHDDAQHDEFYRHLLKVRAQALQSFSGRFHPVNPDCLHLTVADLISGSNYRANRERTPALKDAIRDRLDSISTKKAPVEKPLAWRTAGLAFFQHALVCLLAPAHERDYTPVVEVRDDIYDDSAMQQLGVRRPRPFMAHITLAYYEAFPKAAERQKWVLAHASLQRALMSHDARFLIRRIDLRAFEDMTAFDLVSPNVGLNFGRV